MVAMSIKHLGCQRHNFAEMRSLLRSLVSGKDGAHDQPELRLMLMMMMSFENDNGVGS